MYSQFQPGLRQHNAARKPIIRYYLFFGEWDVTSECEIEAAPSRMSVVSESEAVLGLLSRNQVDNNERHIAAANSAWSNISAIMQSHPALAKTAAEHLGRLHSLLTVLQKEPDIPPLPPALNEHEPSNKKAAKQRHFVSTRRAKRPRQQLTDENTFTACRCFCDY